MASARPRFTPLFERFLAGLGAGITLAVSVRAWMLLAGVQPLWPLPALYFLEVMALGLAGFLGALYPAAPTGFPLAWAAAGALLAFCGMGAWSVGFYFLPGTLLLALSALLADLRLGRRLWPGLGAFALAAVAQVLLMLAVIGLA